MARTKVIDRDELRALLRVAAQARNVERHLTRVFGRQVKGHDIPTTQAVCNLRGELALLDSLVQSSDAVGGSDV